MKKNNDSDKSEREERKETGNCSYISTLPSGAPLNRLLGQKDWYLEHEMLLSPHENTQTQLRSVE